MCDRIVSKEPFMLIYSSNRYKIQNMCDEAVDDCLTSLKLIPYWFFTSKMLESFLDALFTNDDILFFVENFSEVTLFANEMSIVSVHLDKINLDDDNNFYGDDS